jgi:HEAT repeat protein
MNIGKARPRFPSWSALQDSSPNVRQCAIRVAGRIGVPALSILEQAMADNDPDVRGETFRAISKLRGSAQNPQKA